METKIIYSVVILLVIGAFFMTGCAGKMFDDYGRLVKKIPALQFEEFLYERNGIWSTAKVKATGASYTEDSVIYETVEIDLKYGPQTAKINLKNYTRKREGDQSND